MSPSLPRILIIDDQYASNPFLRAQLCEVCKLEDISSRAKRAISGSGEDRIAEAFFCSAQGLTAGRVENRIEEAERAVAIGWPAREGWRWSLILLDLRFDSAPPGLPQDENFGLRILETLVSRWPDPERPGNCEIPVIILSSIERARYGTGANRGGAAEYVEKDRLNAQTLRQLLMRHGLCEDPSGRIVGQSLALLKVLKKARTAAAEARGNLLILGEQGTGKSALARYVHFASPRASAPFHSLTVGPGMEAHLLKTQLYGFWYGAYTPADKSEAGLAERAHQGVLFIDEIANLPAMGHQELLEYGRVDANGLRHLTRLGTYPTSPAKVVDQANKSLRGLWDKDTQSILVDVFLISATNKPIHDPSYRSATGFPEDLFVRLGQEYHAPIIYPTLRERLEDIVTLFNHFLRLETQRSGGLWPKVVDKEVCEALEAHDWPGNIAELAGVARDVERVTRTWEEVHSHHLPRLDRKQQTPVHSAPPQAEAFPSPAHRTLADAIAALESAEVRDSRKELDGALSQLTRAYGSLLERLLAAALDATRDKSARDKDPVLRDLSPTRAISLLLNKPIKTDKAADEIKRLTALLPQELDPASELGRVLSWAVNLRKGRKR